MYYNIEPFTNIEEFQSVEHFSLGKLFKGGAKEAAQEATEKTAKETAEKIAKKTAKETAEKASKESVERSIKSSLKKSFGKIDKSTLAKGVGGLGALGVGAYLFGEQQRKDGKQFQITSITDSSSLMSSKAKIKISKGEKFSKNDSVTLSDTDSTPALNGTFKIVNVISQTEIEISTDKKLTKSGKKGNLVLNTTFMNQLGSGIKDLGSGINNLAENILPDQMNPFKLIEGLSENAGIISLISCIVIILCSISMSIIKFA